MSDAIEVPLPSGHIALVDTEDTWVNCFEWQLKTDGPRFYVRTVIGRYRIMLHQAILGKTPAGFTIDHINGDGLDNRRYNLRFCTPSENSANRQSMRYGNKVLPLNVSDRGPEYAGRCYRVRVTKNYITYHIGDFPTVAEAQEAAIIAKKRIHGAISIAP